MNRKDFCGYRVSSRRYRNRRIGEFLKKLHLTEGRNTGFQKIVRSMKANGSPAPIFATDADRTFFLTTLLIQPSFIDSAEPIKEPIKEPINDCLTSNEAKILELMKADPSVTREKMVMLLELSESTIRRAMKSLKEKNRISREGSNKNGKWIILK